MPRDRALSMISSTPKLRSFKYNIKFFETSIYIKQFCFVNFTKMYLDGLLYYL